MRRKLEELDLPALVEFRDRLIVRVKYVNFLIAEIKGVQS